MSTLRATLAAGFVVGSAASGSSTGPRASLRGDNRRHPDVRHLTFHGPFHGHRHSYLNPLQLRYALDCHELRCHSQ